MIRQNHPEAFREDLQISNTAEPKCRKCGDAGWYPSKIDYERGVTHQEAILCECKAAERAKRLIEASGLGNALSNLRMDNFFRSKQHQQTMYDAATGFLGSSAEWLFLGGQPGCGKTHLCTAVCGELLEKGTPVRYMLWADQIQRIKAGINDQEVLDELLEPVKRVDVLYIDDLFKGSPRRDGVLCPTDSDKRLAFEIFNHRYVAGLRTIISCEWNMAELIDVDQGTFSRVYERCKQYMVYVAPDKAKNWRLR